MDVFNTIVGILKKTVFKSYTNSSPSNGDLWYDGTDFCFRKGGATYKFTADIVLQALLTAQGQIPYRDGSGWAALAAGTAGQVLISGGAGANPSWANAPKVAAAYKSADESVTSSTTLQNDDDLKFNIGANENWVFAMPIGLVCGASGGFKYAFTLPSGASAFGGDLTGNATKQIGLDLTTGNGSTNASSATSTQPTIAGYVANGANAGTVQFQFAQNASNGTATTVKKGSILIAMKV